MTRKDYVAIAEAFINSRQTILDGARYELRSESETEAILHGIDLAIKNVADVFAADNGRFDRGRFYRAAAMGAVEIIRVQSKATRERMADRAVNIHYPLGS